MYQWLQRFFSGADAKPVIAPAPAHQPPGLPQASDEASGIPPPIASAAGDISVELKDDVNANYYHWLFDTSASSAPDINATESEMLDKLETIIESEQSGADMVRRMPGLIPQLLQTLRNDTFSGAHLSRTISNDVVLVAALIRLANSSALGTGKTITSIEQAVILIGQKGLRNLITSIAFHPIIDTHSGTFSRMLAPRIWEQSERCAAANRLLAGKMGVSSFDAFLVGLVQYVGLTASLRIMDQISKVDRLFGSAKFCARLLRGSRKLSCSIGSEWEFPTAVTLALAEQVDIGMDTTMSPLGRLLSLGDYLSKVHILVENDRLTEGDARLFHGLTSEELACYQHLDSIGGS